MPFGNLTVPAEMTVGVDASGEAFIKNVGPPSFGAPTRLPSVRGRPQEVSDMGRQEHGSAAERNLVVELSESELRPASATSVTVPVPASVPAPALAPHPRPTRPPRCPPR